MPCERGVREACARAGALVGLLAHGKTPPPASSPALSPASPLALSPAPSPVQFECDHGAGWVVASPHGERLNAMRVLGKSKCCWSRSAPILYTDAPLRCANEQTPQVFHGSQWVSLHRSLVRHIVKHPTAHRVLTAMEHTLLPDEAMLQTIAVNSALRSTLITNHVRFIEW